MVIGAGQMGAGIAQVCAQSGYQVILNDRNESALEKGMATIEKLLHRDIKKERLSETEKKGELERLSLSTDLADANDNKLVIETNIEKMEQKATLFRELEQIAPTHAILATNTTSLPITEIAGTTT